LTDLRAATWVDIIHIDSALDSAAWALWMSRPDKDWSLFDSASFVVMQSQGLTEALTADHQFDQAGFVRLLKSVASQRSADPTTDQPASPTPGTRP
jgi:predicted nucleic acid-binding protein